jgi:hypothetical protein
MCSPFQSVIVDVKAEFSSMAWTADWSIGFCLVINGYP